MRTLESELFLFSYLAQQMSCAVRASHLRVSRPHPNLVVVGPPSDINADLNTPIDLTILGLVHGVEVAGLSVINNILTALLDDHRPIEVTVALALGNVPAARNGQRFTFRDLNRSFGRHTFENFEDVRAKELESVLNRSKYMVDIHQVTMPSAHSFWIFPYRRRALHFAMQLNPTLPVVTHWGASFSQDGQCSDEYMLRRGQTAVTVELGQNGFDEGQIKMGTRIALKAIQTVADLKQSSIFENSTPRRPHTLWTWDEIVPYPETDRKVLDDGWFNFKVVHGGDRLGEWNGQILKAKNGGAVLFPKYPLKKNSNVDTKIPPSKELVRIMKKINLEDLPQDL
jgi:succinylglutamate desuccinylase